MLDQKAKVRLNFVVVGASLAGLASAYTLAKVGHKVVVVDVVPDIPLSYGTIGSSPSMTSILVQWGLQKQIDELFQVCNNCRFFSATTGDFLGCLNRSLMEEIKSDGTAGFMIAYYNDLHRLLREIAAQAGAQTLFNSLVTGLDPTTDNVMLATGEILEADLIIAADGCHSLFRRYIVDEHPEHEELLSLIPPRFVHMMLPISMDKVREDKDLDGILNPISWDYWLGDGYICHGNVSNHEQNSLFAIVQPFSGEEKPEHKIWTQSSDFAAYGVDYSGLDIRVQKLFGMASDFWAKIYENRPLETIVGASPKVILVGEAAHSILPGSYHFPALAFEDAQTLGYLFSKIQDKGQISKFLAAYEDIRQPRLKFVYESELKYRVGLTSPDATLRQRRDQLLKRLSEYNASTSPADVETLMTDWGADFEIMSYDATVHVTDWWRQYGSSIVGVSPQLNGPEDELEIGVVTEVTEHVIE
ncbi:hypothetical protein CPB83DRAFT_859184 [Crepidotus variabilis]|uniref:FAD-binding domain-containing protein n=1 Tax=Crepidotus variabilis TaxID=179855 RepID=A0A9P6EB16_9AGAR|nr:hypothetical protein CPB83DRAFT_859184 [Crepidotus variabilis]